MFYQRVFAPEEFLAKMPADAQALFSSIPGWANVAFGFESICGALGSFALQMRKKLALPLFVLSVIGVLVQSFQIWFLSDAMTVMGPMAIVMPLVALAIGLIMIFLTRKAIARQWVR